MQFSNRTSSTLCAVVCTLTLLVLATTSGCDNGNGRACVNQNDCFVGEACLDGFCVSDPSSDAGGDTDPSGTDAGDDGGSEDAGTEPDGGPQDSGPDDAGPQDSGPQDTGGSDAVEDIGQDVTEDTDESDVGSGVDPVQTCRPSGTSVGAAPWFVQLGTSSNESGRAVATDNAGNTYLASAFSGSLEIGGCLLESGFTQVGRASSALVVKLSPTGEVLWAKSFSDPSGAVAADVAVGPNGDVHVFGSFGEAIDFGGGRLEADGFPNVDTFSDDLFLARLGSDGSHVWSKAFTGKLEDNPGGVAIDGAGNVYLTGWFEDRLAFGNDVIESTTLGEFDVFVAKLDDTGAVTWVTNHGGDERDMGTGVAVDGNGDVYVTGTFEGTASLGTGDIASNDDSEDVFIAKYESDGTPDWVELVYSPRGERGGAIVVDDTTDTVFVTGGYRGNAVAGNQSLPHAQILNVFVASFDTNGDFNWADGYGGDQADWGEDIATDDAGNVYITGTILSETDFGDGDAVDSPGGGAVFAASLDGSGNHRWSRSYGDFGEQDGLSIAVTGAGRAVVTGSFERDFPLDGTEYPSEGGTDIFVLSIDP